jgi:exonuclease SbcD
MKSRIAFRFMHAGDFQLGQVPDGLPDVPDSLGDQLLDAPFTAAGRVFDAAIKNQVDFVLLVGELVSNVSGDVPTPQASLFLSEQFERLHREGINVFLATDSDWPEWSGLPGNVYRVDQTRGITASTRGRQPVATISRLSSLNHTNRVAVGFDIVVAGRDQSPGPIPDDIDYVAAVGNESAGQLSSQTTDSNDRIWSSGTPQGRHINSGKQHGCLVVDVDERNTVDVRFVNTAPVGWRTQHISVTGTDDLTTVAESINSRLAKLAQETDHDCILIDWILDCEGSVNSHVICEAGYRQLLEQVRRCTQAGRTHIHSVDVRVNLNRPIIVGSEPDCVVLADFIELAGRVNRFDAGRTELQSLPWLSSELVAADQAIESRVIRYGFDLLG